MFTYSGQSADPIVRDHRLTPTSMVAAAAIRQPVTAAKVLSSRALIKGTNGLVALERGTKDYEVLVHRGGTNFVSVKDAVTNINGQDFAQLPVGVPYYIRPKGISKVRATNSVILPGEIGVVTSQGHNISGQLSLAQDTIMAYDIAKNDFRTLLSISWETTNTAAEAITLLPLHVGFSTGVFKHDTNYVAIEQPGIQGHKTVLLTAGRSYVNQAITARTSTKNGLHLPDVELVIQAEPLRLVDFFGLLFPWPVWFALFGGGALGAMVRFLKFFREKRGSSKRPWIDALWVVVEGLVIPPATYILLTAKFVSFARVPWSDGLWGAVGWGVLAGLLGTAVIEMLGIPGMGKEKETTEAESTRLTPVS